MIEHSIIMSGFSIPLICAGLKTQSRRPIRWTRSGNIHKAVKVKGARRTFIPLDDERGLMWTPHAMSVEQPWPAERVGEVCPYGGPGARLWVREVWRAWERPSDGVGGVLFRADNAFVRIKPTRAAADLWIEAYDNGLHGARWRSPIFMPRWASRFVLDLVEVRAERVQSISEPDAIAEGVHELWLQQGEPGAWWTLDDKAETPLHARTPVAAYARAWDAIHGAGAWARTDWVWVLTFKLAETAPTGSGC